MSDLDRLLEERYSCRAFSDREVPEETVRAVFELAQRTASWCNTQPWQVTVSRGRATADLSAALLAHAAERPPAADLGVPAGYSGVYRDRRRASGFALYDSLGIAHDDAPARQGQAMLNFSFFGAPHVAVVTSDREQGTYGAVDCGGYVSTLLLALRSRGIDSVAQAAIAMHSDVVRAHLGLAEDRLVVCAVSFGYADPAHPANRFRTERASVDDAVAFLG